MPDKPSGFIVVLIKRLLWFQRLIPENMGKTMYRISANLVAGIFLLLRFTLPVSTAYCFSPGERDSAAQKNIRFLAIADTHIAADSDLLRFRAFLNTVKDRNVGFVIILGDLAAHAPEYLEPIKEIAGRAGLPVYMLPGNHDDNYARNPEWWSSVFGPMNYSFEHRGFHFIMNWSQDTVASLCWLRACLDSIPSGEPIVFCQHFYPRASAAPEGGPWPLLQARADDLILALSGHAHSRFTDTVGTIRSETLANCYMDTTGSGFFYEIALSADRNIILQEFPLSSLSMVSPPDDPPIVALDQDSGYFVFEDRLELSGMADDDGTVESVEWRLDDNPWRPARGTVRWQVSLSADETIPGHHLLQVRARDNLGQATAGFARAVLYVPEKEPPSGTVVLRQ